MTQPTWIDSLMEFWRLLYGLGVDWPRHLFFPSYITWAACYATWIICHALCTSCSQNSTHTSAWSLVDFFIDLCFGFGALWLGHVEHLRWDGLL